CSLNHMQLLRFDIEFHNKPFGLVDWLVFLAPSYKVDSQSPHQTPQNPHHHSEPQETQTAIQKHSQKSCWLLFLLFRFLAFGNPCLVVPLFCSRPLFASCPFRKVAAGWSC